MWIDWMAYLLHGRLALGPGRSVRLGLLDFETCSRFILVWLSAEEGLCCLRKTKKGGEVVLWSR